MFNELSLSNSSLVRYCSFVRTDINLLFQTFVKYSFIHRHLHIAYYLQPTVQKTYKQTNKQNLLNMLKVYHTHFTLITKVPMW